jgi:hypothetical protein
MELWWREASDESEEANRSLSAGTNLGELTRTSPLNVIDMARRFSDLFLSLFNGNYSAT